MYRGVGAGISSHSFSKCPGLDNHKRYKRYSLLVFLRREPVIRQIRLNNESKNISEWPIPTTSKVCLGALIDPGGGRIFGM